MLIKLIILNYPDFPESEAAKLLPFTALIIICGFHSLTFLPYPPLLFYAVYFDTQ